MKHNDPHGWALCPVCRIRYPIGCPACEPTHNRLHHTKRRYRRQKED